MRELYGTNSPFQTLVELPDIIRRSSEYRHWRVVELRRQRSQSDNSSQDITVYADGTPVWTMHVWGACELGASEFLRKALAAEYTRERTIISGISRFDGCRGPRIFRD